MSQESEFTDRFIEAMCGDANTEYLECMGINKGECIQHLKMSINSCPEKYHEKLDMYLIDPVCITNTYIDNTKVSDEIAIKCDDLVNKIEPPERFKKRLMPNKQLKIDAQKARAS